MTWCGSRSSVLMAQHESSTKITNRMCSGPSAEVEAFGVVTAFELRLHPQPT